MGEAPHHRGPTAGAPRLAAPARLLRAQTAPLRERPTKKKGRTRRPAPRAPTRISPRATTRMPRVHRRAPSARSDVLLRRAPTAHLRRARRVLPARRRAHPAHPVRTHTTRDTRHHSHILLCDRYLVHGWAPMCPITKPLTNHLQTARQPLISFPHSVYIRFFLFVLLGNVQASFTQCLGGYGGPLSPGRTNLLAPSLARPRPVARRAPRPHPRVVCPGFGLDKLIDRSVAFGGGEMFQLLPTSLF